MTRTFCILCAYLKLSAFRHFSFCILNSLSSSSCGNKRRRRAQAFAFPNPDKKSLSTLFYLVVGEKRDCKIWTTPPPRRERTEIKGQRGRTEREDLFIIAGTLCKSCAIRSALFSTKYAINAILPSFTCRPAFWGAFTMTLNTPMQMGVR